jgi:hypothetical protein
MNARCKNRIFNTLFWIAAEILLNVTGLDNLADYSEFVFENHSEIKTHQPMVTRSLPPNSYNLTLLLS